jgi:FecR protein
MTDDYLWNKSGPPDPEIERIEHALGRLRFNRPAPIFATLELTSTATRSPRVNWCRAASAAAFAVILFAVGSGLLWWWKEGTAGGWVVTEVSGTPRVGPNWIGNFGRVGLGQVLETDGRSRVEIQLPQVGRIEIDPQSRLRVLVSPTGASRLALDRGTIHARIWALPGAFVVDTPAARAVDLGCVYTLHVDDSGDGLIRTSMGWVGFNLGDTEAFIPAGAACKTRMKTGPGIPYFEDAPEKLRAAATTFDLPAGSAADRNVSLQTILAQSRTRDAFTLWHLLSRVDDSQREEVYDRLAALIPPPASVTLQGIRKLDREMLDRWWNALGLGDITLWRHWERSWSDSSQNTK